MTEPCHVGRELFRHPPPEKMTDTKKILIIEDDLRIAQNISKGLIEKGFETEVAYDGKIGVRLALSNSFDRSLLLPSQAPWPGWP